MKSLTRRWLSTAVALLVAASSVVVCAPAGNAAAAPHCPPAAADAGHDCCGAPQPPSTMDCCAGQGEHQKALPEPARAQGSRGACPWSPDAQPVTVPAAIAPGLTRGLHAAPVHGHRSTDLPTLHSSFLI